MAHGNPEPAAAELRRALARPVSSPAHRMAVLKAVLDSELLVPLVAATGPEEVPRARTARDEFGHEALPTFTTSDGLARFAGPRSPFGLATGREAARLARDMRLDAMVIDPTGPATVVLDAREVHLLADGIVPVEGGSARAYGHRLVGPLEQALPGEVMDAARRIAADPDVERLRLRRPLRLTRRPAGPVARPCPTTVRKERPGTR